MDPFASTSRGLGLNSALGCLAQHYYKIFCYRKVTSFINPTVIAISPLSFSILIVLFMFSPSSGVNFAFCLFLRKYFVPSSILLFLILKFCSRFHYPSPIWNTDSFYCFPQAQELAVHVVQPLICVALESYDLNKFHVWSFASGFDVALACMLWTFSSCWSFPSLRLSPAAVLRARAVRLPSCGRLCNCAGTVRAGRDETALGIQLYGSVALSFLFILLLILGV